MNIKPELAVYLEEGKNKLNVEFPKHIETTAELFLKVQDFLSADFEGIPDNRVYRRFLDSFREIICFAFEKDVSKAYLRCFFKIINHKEIVEHLENCAKSRATDIKNVMNRFVGFFTATWQDSYDNKEKKLEEIISSIDYWM